MCSVHGGKAPQVKAAADRRVAAAKATRTAARWSEGTSPADLNPVDELLKIASKIIAFQNAVESMLAELPEGDWRRDHRAGEQIHALVTLFERSLDRCAKVLIDINKLGLEEKRIRLQEQESMILVGVIRSVLDQLELSPGQRILSRTVVPDALRAVSGDQAGQDSAPPRSGALLNLPGSSRRP